MKIKLLLIIGMMVFIITCTKDKGATKIWIQKADFGGWKRCNAVGFSIGTKGYIGTGAQFIDIFTSSFQDFWEWNQISNVWTQKANFAGMKRFSAVGFSIGSKGYIGTGAEDGGNNKYYIDFWEWDQSSNVWTQKADFGGMKRYKAVGFSIGNKGYIGTGTDTSGYSTNDFWEWDQSSNVWTKKADFGGTKRNSAVGFSIGTKGYIGTGANSLTNYGDFWEWNQATNIWTQKADFAGTARNNATGFSIGTKGYIGTGRDDSFVIKKDFWEWDEATNIWIQKTNFGGTARNGAVSFSVGTKGYIGSGVTSRRSGAAGDLTWDYFNDFWQFDPNI